MLEFRRSDENPILTPAHTHPFEAEAVFNPSVVRSGAVFHMLYRAVTSPREQAGQLLEVSSIGYAKSSDGVHFRDRRQFVKPELEWERFGCEDPRVTKFEGAYYIFYTALSTFPFSADGIKVGVAVTRDFKTIREKHLVTPFNAKAMCLFPERIGGKIVAMLTVNTDRPPSKICLALFDRIEQLWSEEYWNAWYQSVDIHKLRLPVDGKDHVEVGAPPVKTKHGWMFLYSYIRNYFAPPAQFGVEAVLLDLNIPFHITGVIKHSLLSPEEEYERYGKVPNIVFPTSVVINKSKLDLYYGAADTTVCLATVNFREMIGELTTAERTQLVRYTGNPIITPNPDHWWEAKATFNPAALYEDGKVHILYRAMSQDNTSVFGYATSADGIRIDMRAPEPVYTPRIDYEKKSQIGNSGCEDPRLTRIGDTIYMCYTAFNGMNPPRVAFSSIALNDFLARQWKWTIPVLISPPGVDDKDAALFPRKIKGKYVFLHRLGNNIWIDSVDSLSFTEGRFLGGSVLMTPRTGILGSKRIGIAGPPIETDIGWLLLYHGISKRSNFYSVRAALLDGENPAKILARTEDTILEPDTQYEKEGEIPNVVFPCGAVVIGGELFVYYGAADKYIGVATVKLRKLTEELWRESKRHKA